MYLANARVLTAGDTSSVIHTQYWIPNLLLKDEHHILIACRGNFLDNALIDAAQKLISKHSSDIKPNKVCMCNECRVLGNHNYIGKP